MIKYYRIVASNGYCGCDREEYVEHDSERDGSLDELAWSITMENAESFAYCAFGWGEVPSEDSDEYQEYLENCTYSIDEVTKEEYDENF